MRPDIQHCRSRSKELITAHYCLTPWEAIARLILKPIQTLGPTPQSLWGTTKSPVAQVLRGASPGKARWPLISCWARNSEWLDGGMPPMEWSINQTEHFTFTHSGFWFRVLIWGSAEELTQSPVREKHQRDVFPFSDGKSAVVQQQLLEGRHAPELP